MRAFPPTRPTRLRSPSVAIPRTIVKNTIGAITIFTRFTNVSPSGRIAFAVPGATTPRITPRVIATRTRNVRLLRRRRIGGWKREARTVLGEPATGNGSTGNGSTGNGEPG